MKKSCSLPPLKLKDGSSNTVPRMSPDEIRFLLPHLNSSTNMLEYGSGYSTKMFAEHVGSLTTVEHHGKWYEEVKRLCSNYDNIEHVHVPMNVNRMSLVPPDWKKRPESLYGFPTPWECVVDYCLWPLKQKTKWDVVFIDGRARQIVGAMVLNNLHEDSVVFVHDYVDRERYFCLEDIYEKVEVVDSMIKFKVKKL